MFKLNFFMRKRVDLSLDQFSCYWRERHGPYAMSGRTTRLGMRRYVQNHLIVTPLTEEIAGMDGLAGAPYEGICQLWFDSEESVLRKRASADGAGATNDLVEDERQFLNLDSSAIRFYREENILGRLAGSGAAKLVIGAFLLDGKDEIGPKISALVKSEASAGGLAGAVQNFGLDTSANESLRSPRGNSNDAFDYVLELWFADYAMVADAVSRREGLLSQMMDELRPRLAQKGAAAWVVQERLMIGGAQEVAAAA